VAAQFGSSNRRRKLIWFWWNYAHVVVQEAQDDLPPGRRDRNVLVFPISARSPQALAELARLWIDHLRSTDTDAVGLQNICYTAAVRRTHHDYRLACVAESKEELIRCLQAFSDGEAFPGMCRKPCPTHTSSRNYDIGMTRSRKLTTLWKTSFAT
jgi:acyl transferase domain-containing protein